MTRGSRRVGAFEAWVKRVNPRLDQSGIRDAFNAGWAARKELDATKEHNRNNAATRHASKTV